MMNAVQGGSGVPTKTVPANADPKVADGYEVAIDRDQSLMRILHRNATGVLSYQVLPADEAYALAQKILQGYDQLEGI